MSDFNDTATAFAGKSDGGMRNAVMLFGMMRHPGIVKAGKRLAGVAAVLRLPIGWALKPTLYRQFVGGETLEACAPAVAALARRGVRSALDYSTESRQTPSGIEAVFAETGRSIVHAARNGNIAFAVFKPSTLTTDALLAKASEHPETLTPEERKEYEAFAGRFDALCALAGEQGVRLLVDAEDFCFQDAIDRLTEEAMRKYNGRRAVVFATLQMYRCDRMAYLRRLYEDASRQEYVAGVKFVRGAYMESERACAAAMGYPGPIAPRRRRPTPISTRESHLRRRTSTGWKFSWGATTSKATACSRGCRTSMESHETTGGCSPPSCTAWATTSRSTWLPRGTTRSNTYLTPACGKCCRT